MTYAGVDPIFEPIPVRPGAHYHMGGVETDEWGLTELEGLYAAGETACISVHGANRLGGNSLMETITFGRRSAVTPPSTRSAAAVGRTATRSARTTPRRGQGPARRPDRRAALADPRRAGQSMLENFGVFRYPDRMEKQIGLIDGSGSATTVGS